MNNIKRITEYLKTLETNPTGPKELEELKNSVNPDEKELIEQFVEVLAHAANACVSRMLLGVLEIVTAEGEKQKEHVKEFIQAGAAMHIRPDLVFGTLKVLNANLATQDLIAAIAECMDATVKVIKIEPKSKSEKGNKPKDTENKYYSNDSDLQDMINLFKK